MEAETVVAITGSAITVIGSIGAAAATFDDVYNASYVRP